MSGGVAGGIHRAIPGAMRWLRALAAACIVPLAVLAALQSAVAAPRATVAAVSVVPASTLPAAPASTSPALPAAGLPALLERPWTEYRTASFTLYSDIDEPQAQRSVRDIEQFVQVVREVVGLQHRASPIPVEFWLCAQVSCVTRLAGDSTLLGFMRPSPRASYLVAKADALDDATTSPMLHEMVHLLVRSGSGPVPDAGGDSASAARGALDLPRWYDEGLAEFLSTLRVRDGVVRFGVPNRPRVEHLRSRTEYLISLGQVLETSDLERSPNLRVADFYGLSWALVHWSYAKHWAGPGTRNVAIDDYLRRVSAGEPARAAARGAFGSDVRALEARLKAYVDHLRAAPLARLPVARFALQDAAQPVARRPLDPYEAAYRLGYVALGGDADVARELFAAALRARPADARAEMGLAVADQFEEAFAAGVQRARAVYARAPDDSLLAQELADMLYEWCDSEQPPPDCAGLHAEAIALYERILRTAPERIETHAALGSVLLDAHGDAARARVHLRRAYAAMPFSSMLVLQLGRAEMRLGERASAERWLQRAERWAETSRLARRVEAARREFACGGGAADASTC